MRSTQATVIWEVVPERKRPIKTLLCGFGRGGAIRFRLWSLAAKTFFGLLGERISQSVRSFLLAREDELFSRRVPNLDRFKEEAIRVSGSGKPRRQ